LNPSEIPSVECAFGHAEELGGVAHVAGADELGGAFEEPFGGVGSFGDEGDRWRESMSTVFASELVDADLEFDGVGSDGEVVDAFAGASLFDGLASVLAVRAESDFVLGREREEESFLDVVLVDVGDAEVGEMEDLSPEEELSSGIHEAVPGAKMAGRDGVRKVEHHRHSSQNQSNFPKTGGEPKNAKGDS
jgi:hypothetical protein